MNSDEFPLSTFKGVITNLKKVNFEKDGTYTANIEGDLTIHGETQKITIEATIIVIGKSITATSSFSVKLEDYKINGPAVGAGKVSKDPNITISAEFN